VPLLLSSPYHAKSQTVSSLFASILTFVFICFTCFASKAATDANVDVFFVATNGNDTWSGQLAAPNSEKTDGPLATLAAARDKLRKLKKTRDSTVMVRGGTYELPQTLVFTPDDSGTPGHPVTYCSFSQERVTLTGGRTLKGWRKEGRLWVADVPQNKGRWYFAQLFMNGKLQRRSWEPDNSDWKKWPVTTRGLPHNELHLPTEAVDLYYPADLIKSWPNLKDIEVTLLAQFRWANNVVPLKSVDEAAKHAVLAAPASYNINANDPFRVENTIEGIDEPGEWCLNTTEGKIYLLAPDGVDVAHTEIIAPKLYQLIHVQGDEKNNRLVHDIVFRGFTFNGANRHQWDEADESFRVGHFTAIDTAVYLEGIANCAIEDCRFVGLAGNAIELNHAAMDNRIVRNEIAGAGGCGIRLHGYEPGTTDVNKRNTIELNHIHDIARDFWASPAVLVWQSGENSISHNYIHDVGYVGISLGGAWVENFRLWKGKSGHGIRWDEIPADDPLTRESVKKFLHARNNRVEYNVIHDHIQSGFHDGGGIYTVSLGVGNKLNGNLIYHAPMERSFGISLDHQSDHITVTGNIVFGCNTAASNSDSMKNILETDLAYGSESNKWENNLIYGPVFTGTPPGQGEVPPSIVQAAKLMTKLAEVASGPSWIH
jgi:Right handed beta helix region